nr:MAG TPA: major capsid protein [Caudoviricetes sp.]
MLKALILRKRIDDMKKQLAELRGKDADFKKREEELSQAFAEATEDTPEEDKKNIEGQMTQYDEDQQAHEKEKTDLEKSIQDTEKELEDIEKAQKDKEPESGREGTAPENVRGGYAAMKTRAFRKMTAEQRSAFVRREDVKQFLDNVRAIGAGSQQRAIKGGDLLIPEIVLGLIKENVEEFSKLYKHVNVRQVAGTARQNIMGTIPEAIWTEACASLNEIDLSFTVEEVDGYKVGAYIAICNATLHDADINLADETISAIGKAIGFALDKAILYGTGTKMPTGIMAALEADSDLKTKNIISIPEAKTDAALYKELVLKTAIAEGKYSTGAKFWAMNDKTKAKLVAAGLSINAAGAIVSGQGNTLPVVGGEIETLYWMPDNVIIGGYGDLYLLAEREGTTLATSEHVRFLQDETVFKGEARYDGKPVIKSGFVAIGINGATPAKTDVTFTEDKANKASAGNTESSES